MRSLNCHSELLHFTNQPTQPTWFYSILLIFHSNLHLHIWFLVLYDMSDLQVLWWSWLRVCIGCCDNIFLLDDTWQYTWSIIFNSYIVFPFALKIYLTPLQRKILKLVSFDTCIYILWMLKKWLQNDGFYSCGHLSCDWHLCGYWNHAYLFREGIKNMTVKEGGYHLT